MAVKTQAQISAEWAACICGIPTCDLGCDQATQQDIIDSLGTFPSPPNGVAGGDLTGTYPSPTINASVNLTGTPTIASTPSTGDNSKSIADTAYVDAQGGDFTLQSYKALGSVLLAQTVGFNLNRITTSASLASQSAYMAAVYLPITQTLTGVKWWNVTQGSFTANNYNGVALYSYSAGTLTLVASSTNDASGALWKTASASIGSKAFSGTYSATAGLYFVMALYSSSAQTTAPALGSGTALQNAAIVGGDFTNSAFLFGFKAGQTSLPSPLTASTVSQSTVPVWFGLY